MQKIKDLRNLAKSKGIKVTYINKQGIRKYYTKKELLAKLSKHVEKGGYAMGGEVGGSWGDFLTGLEMPFKAVGKVAEVVKPALELFGGKMQHKKAPVKKMTAGAIDDKRERVKSILDKLTSIVEHRMLKPDLEKYYS